MRLSPRPRRVGPGNRLRAALLAGPVIGACAAAILTGTVSAAPSKPVSSTADNRRAARLDAIAHVGRPVLAVASYQAFAGLTDSSGPCNPIRLSIRGHHESALLGGDFVPRAQRILGFRLTPPLSGRCAKLCSCPPTSRSRTR